MRTDLAIEAVQNVKESAPAGVKSEIYKEGEIKIERVSVSDSEGEKAIGKPVGEYFTLSTGDLKSPAAGIEERSLICGRIIRRLLLGHEKHVLVACLGNRDITPDALGPCAAQYIIATRHIPNEMKKSIGFSGDSSVSVIAPGVMGQTGIESAEVIRSLVKEISPSAVIAIDALAASGRERLAKTVQIGNAGISPGSGVQNKRKELSQKTLGVPVIAVGVPTVTDIGCENGGAPLIVTPREIDLVIEHAAKTVAYAVNTALLPELSFEDMVALSG